MTVYSLPVPEQRHGLLAEISAIQAEIGARQARLSRLIERLGNLPDGPEPTPRTPARSWMPIKAAAREFGISVDTLRRRGEPLGWAWRQGGRCGRWVIDPAGLAEFLTSRQVA